MNLPEHISATPLGFKTGAVLRMTQMLTKSCRRIAALTTERMSWEEWKKVQKEAASKASMAEEEEEAQMRAYRAQLDADRLKKLSKGTNNAHLRAQVRHTIRSGFECLILMLKIHKLSLHNVNRRTKRTTVSCR